MQIALKQVTDAETKKKQPMEATQAVLKDTGTAEASLKCATEAANLSAMKSNAQQGKEYFKLFDQKYDVNRSSRKMEQVNIIRVGWHTWMQKQDTVIIVIATALLK